jgi:hypothetical protein
MLDDEDATARAWRELDEYLAPLYLEEEQAQARQAGSWHVVRDRVEQENSVARVPKSGPSAWSWLRR